MLKPALYFAGVVVDEQGKPIPGVSIRAYANGPRSSANVEDTESRSDGSFELFNYPEKPFVLRDDAVCKGVVHFFHPDYIDRRIDDLYAIEPKQRGALRAVLEAGYKVTGKVVDDAGKPVANAMIRAIRKDKTHRKGTTTDASGSFALRGVSGGLIMLTARALDIRQRDSTCRSPSRATSSAPGNLPARSSCPPDFRRRIPLQQYAARRRHAGAEIHLRSLL